MGMGMGWWKVRNGDWREKYTALRRLMCQHAEIRRLNPTRWRTGLYTIIDGQLMAVIIEFVMIRPKLALQCRAFLSLIGRSRQRGCNEAIIIGINNRPL